MSELETLKEELTYSINKFRKFSTSKDDRLVKYSEQERYILLFMYENLKQGIEYVSAKDIMKKLFIGKEVLSRTMRKLISMKAVLRKVNVNNKRCVNYCLTKTTISDCVVIQASLDSDIESLINILGVEDSKSLIRIITKAFNAIELKQMLGEVED